MDWTVTIPLYIVIAIAAVSWWSRARESKPVAIFFTLVAVGTLAKLITASQFPTGNLIGIQTSVWATITATILLYTGAYVIAQTNSSRTLRFAALCAYIVTLFGSVFMGIVASSLKEYRTTLLVASSFGLVAIIALLALAAYTLLKKEVSPFISIGFVIVLAGISPFQRFFPNSIVNIFTLVCLLAILIGAILDARKAMMPRKQKRPTKTT